MKISELTIMKMIILAGLVIGLAWGLSPIPIEKSQEEIQVELPEKTVIDEPQVELLDQAKRAYEYQARNTSAYHELSNTRIIELSKKSEPKQANKEGFLLALALCLAIVLIGYIKLNRKSH